MEPEMLARVVRKCFPQIKVRRFAAIGEGWDRTALEVNGKLVFLFPKRPDGEERLQTETKLLPELEKRLSVRIPHFEFIWGGGKEYPGRFVGYRKIPGIPLGRWCLKSPHLDKLIRHLSDFLSELHRFPKELASRLGLPCLSAIEWRKRYKILYGQVRKRVYPMLDAKARRRVTEFWEDYFADLDMSDFSPALVHSDLAGTHILCHRGLGEVEGVIDWTDALVGDPALDFTGLLDDCGPGATEKVLESYRGDQGSNLLNRTTFYSQVVPFYEILYGLDFERSEIEYGLQHLRRKILD